MRVLIVLGLIGAACAMPRDSFIVGGEETPIERYPFMAGMLGLSWEGVFYLACGGTLISPTAVVSAAHCFEYSVPSAVRVRLGTNKDTSGGVEYIVSRITIHPNYHPVSLRSDILVMRLRDPVQYTPQISSARIAGRQYPLPDNSVVYAVGWGDIQYGGPHSPILRHVAVNVINHEICVERYNYGKTLPEMSDLTYVSIDQLCTGILDVGGKDACTGDSGGPVIHNGDVLVGIISTGYECAHPRYPGVNVRVSSYADWIYATSVNNTYYY